MSQHNNLTQNRKIKEMQQIDGLKTFNFGITALKSCTFAGACAEFCYAKKGTYIWSNVKPAFERRLEATKRDNFVDLMIEEIVKKKADRIRIHDSGDFYSFKYLCKWIIIAKHLPNVQFYAYTKSIPFIQLLKYSTYSIPDNLKLIQSYGGLRDYMIDKNKPHAVIFDSRQELLDAGYLDASKDDTIAAKVGNIKIGLVKH